MTYEKDVLIPSPFSGPRSNPTPTKLLVVSLRFSALGRGLLWRHTDALRGWILALSFEAGFAREEISAVVAEGDLEWVCLHGVIVALKVTLCLESNIGTEAALDRYEGSRRTSRTIVSRVNIHKKRSRKKMCRLLQKQTGRGWDQMKEHNAFSFWVTDVVKPALGTTQGTTPGLPCYPAIIHPRAFT